MAEKVPQRRDSSFPESAELLVSTVSIDRCLEEPVFRKYMINIKDEDGEMTLYSVKRLLYKQEGGPG